MTPALVLVAIPEELRPLRRALGGRRDVVVACTGTGAVRARRATRELIAGLRPRFVLLTGLAGSLTDRLVIGEVRLAREVHEAGGRVRLPDASVLERARAAGLGEAVLVSAPRLVRGREARERLRRAAGAPAAADVLVDLESAACAGAATAAGVPWLAVRAVSDGVGDELPAWLEEAQDGGGGLDRRRVLLGALRRPARLPALVRLARRARTGSRALARVVPAVVASILEPGSRA